MAENEGDTSTVGCLLIVAAVGIGLAVFLAITQKDPRWYWGLPGGALLLWVVFTNHKEAIRPKDLEIRIGKERMGNTRLKEENERLRQALSGYKETDRVEQTIGQRFSRERKAIDEYKAVLEMQKLDLEKREEKLSEEQDFIYDLKTKSLAEIKAAENETRVLLERCWTEKSAGFPSLAAKFSEAWAATRKGEIQTLIKRAPVKALDLSKMLTREIRQIKESEIVHRNLVEYYERIYPELIALKEGEVATVEDVEKNREHGKDWLSEEEWNELDEAGRSQLALDRFCARNKSKWEIGIEYERFCGWRLEMQGWKVDYQGALRGLNDLGRDLVARKDGEILVVQCKYWAEHKEIHEKHVFQTYGAMMALRMDEPNMKITGVLATSTQLSERARKFGKVLEIVLKEKDKLKPFPRIKCNERSMIYHLPFDQMYDQTRSSNYCLTTKEAEEKGFRRAWKWTGA